MNVSLTGRDAHKLNGRILTDFADGDCVNIEFDQELTTIKKGKNANAIYAINENGKIAKVTYRMLAGSPDDKFLNSLILNWENDPAAFVLMTAESVKRIGDGSGGISNVTYAMSGGAFKKRPSMKENAEGDTEQAVVVWELAFGQAPRSIG